MLWIGTAAPHGTLGVCQLAPTRSASPQSDEGRSRDEDESRLGDGSREDSIHLNWPPRPFARNDRDDLPTRIGPGAQAIRCAPKRSRLRVEREIDQDVIVEVDLPVPVEIAVQPA